MAIAFSLSCLHRSKSAVVRSSAASVPSSLACWIESSFAHRGERRFKHLEPLGVLRIRAAQETPRVGERGADEQWPVADLLREPARFEQVLRDRRDHRRCAEHCPVARADRREPCRLPRVALSASRAPGSTTAAPRLALARSSRRRLRGGRTQRPWCGPSGAVRGGPVAREFGIRAFPADRPLRSRRRRRGVSVRGVSASDPEYSVVATSLCANVNRPAATVDTRPAAPVTLWH